MKLYEIEQFKEFKTENDLTLNTVYTSQNGHDYLVQFDRTKTQNINFVKGGRNTPEYQEGLTDSDLLNILIDRAEYFIKQFGINDKSDERLEHLKKALYFTELRTVNRDKNGTLGNNGEDYKDGKNE